jgi:hypothetical protein
LEKCFLYIFASGLSPYNDSFLTYSITSTKNSKIQVIWDLGRGNPSNLGRINGICHVMAPSALTWCMQLFVTVSCVWGRERALDMATASPKLKCFF